MLQNINKSKEESAIRFEILKLLKLKEDIAYKLLFKRVPSDFFLEGEMFDFSPFELALKNNQSKLLEIMLYFIFSQNGNDDAKKLFSAQLSERRFMYQITYKAFKGIWELLIPHMDNELLNFQDDLGDTVLMYALKKQQYEIVTLLLNAGADADTKNDAGDIPLLLAKQNRAPEEIITALIATMSNNMETTVATAIEKDNVELLERLFNTTAHNDFPKMTPFKKIDGKQINILEYAVLNKATKCLEYLLKNKTSLEFSEEELMNAFCIITTIKSHINDYTSLFLKYQPIRPDKLYDSIMTPENQPHTTVVPIRWTALDMLILGNADIKTVKQLLEQKNMSYNLNYTSHGKVKGCQPVNPQQISWLEQYYSPAEACVSFASNDQALNLLSLLFEHGADINYLPENGYGTMMHAVMQRGDEKLIELCLAQHPELTVTSRDNSTLLHELTSNLKHHECSIFVDTLLKAGVDINRQEDKGLTALHIAVMCNNMTMVKKLLDCGTKTDIKDLEDKTPSEYAKNGAIADLFAKPAQSNPSVQQERKTPKIKAQKREQKQPIAAATPIDPAVQRIEAIKQAIIAANQEEIAQLLTAETINNALDNDGNTPLIWAIKNSHINSIQTLLNLGADATPVNNNRQTGWIIALEQTRNNQPDILGLLLENPLVKRLDAEGNSPIHIAAATGNINAIDFIRNHFIKDLHAVEQYNNAGDTPLTIATKKEDTELAHYLIEQCHADPNTASKDGILPIFYAIKHNNISLIELLIQAGADVNKTDRNGNTALHYAAAWSGKNIIEFLIESGADGTIINKAKRTPACVLPADIDPSDTTQINRKRRETFAKILEQAVKSQQTKMRQKLQQLKPVQDEIAAAPTAPAVAAACTQSYQIAEFEELAHKGLSREKLQELYQKFVNNGNVTGLFEYCTELVDQSIATIPEINDQINIILGSETEKPCYSCLSVVRPSDYRFTGPETDLLIAAPGISPLKDELVQLISNETAAIRIACYCLTNLEIVRALLFAAKQRNVPVEIIVDKSCLQALGKALDIFAAQNIPVYISSDKHYMHHKFALFYSQQAIWTGSGNFTQAGLCFNYESALVSHNLELFNAFETEFNCIASQLSSYKPIIIQPIAAMRASSPTGQPYARVQFTQLRAQIIKLIKNERTNITIAAHLLSDESIINALSNASKRNVAIQIIVDKSTPLTENLMHERNISVKFYNSTGRILMHHKTLIFKSQGIVVVGSANLTEDALSDNNYENMVIINDPALAQFYYRIFVTKPLF